MRSKIVQFGFIFISSWRGSGRIFINNPSPMKNIRVDDPMCHVHIFEQCNALSYGTFRCITDPICKQLQYRVIWHHEMITELIHRASYCGQARRITPTYSYRELICRIQCTLYRYIPEMFSNVADSFALLDVVMMSMSWRLVV